MIFRVYPRAYGGTTNRYSIVRRQRGLSPCVRGNQRRASAEASAAGSIPVRTGEPFTGCNSPHMSRVYPRAYGGTYRRAHGQQCQAGLSPCVRGNHDPPAIGRLHRGSIPVRTGEPRQWRVGSRVREVYPRAYGGTGTSNPTNSTPRGLSPCVRGNHGVGFGRVRRERSIPVRTGEPLRISAQIKGC